MSACHPAFERLSRVYVQVPSSPHAMSSYRPLCNSASTPSGLTTKLKENAPLCIATHHKSQEQSTSASANLKRKASERDSSSLVLDGVVIISKKSKLSASALKPTQIQADNSAHDASNAADSSTWCHQCNRKRPKEGKCLFSEIYVVCLTSPQTPFAVQSLSTFSIRRINQYESVNVAPSTAGHV